VSDLIDALVVLHEHGVRFVVIGAFSAVAQGYPLATEDVDVTPARGAENLELLAAALEDLGAKLRLPGTDAMDFPIEPRSLANADVWTLTTRAGDLDIVFEPPATRGYDDLVRDAVQVELRGTPVLLASLRDVIRMKEAAGRPKDLAQLPALRQTLEVIREREARERSG
jgi:hypothetical protein